ncbi:MAG: bifunctional glutamate N-acetyltransferase/amino-acid acetyltransferase ArgJ [Dehalococcoidia bacterium]|nr:bifunctional glutamate N-acetyltransferase/amino-acid acetyltransferase ArgJ [Dehalococcoidia bacterium]
MDRALTGQARLLAEGHVTSPRGFRAGGAYAGIKTAGPGVLDVGVLVSDGPLHHVAARFTRNMVVAAPVTASRARVAAGDVRAVVVNSGCANACTGAQGDANAEEMARLAAARLGLRPEQVALSSTGLIGSQLPMERIAAGIAGADPAADGGERFARAIMTTDPRPKMAAAWFEHGGIGYTVGGVVKGAGMIHPNMATMLSYLTTDAPVPVPALDAALGRVVERTYNMVTVDGDSSTNDTVLLFANGAGGGELDEAGLRAFESALLVVCISLARQIARDAEGAERLIEVTVQSAVNDADARLAARTVAGSILLKSAVHGGDPNWGRAVAAIGRSGAAIDPARLRLSVGGVLLFSQGQPVPFDRRAVEDAMRGEDVTFAFDLGLGEGEATAWGCDLSEEYVRFNSEYST